MKIILSVLVLFMNLNHYVFCDINAQLEPSRTSGVAPLFVFFDATGTTDTSVILPFHELYYDWNFGDTSSGIWTYSGKSRNSSTGVVSAHVFEDPGTYSVELTIKNLNGDSANQAVIISVQDPDVVFNGTNTICFSQTGDFTQSPPGALTITTSSYSEVMSYISTGKRLLLRRGETWNADLVTIDNHGPGIIGSFGTGADPILNNGFFKLASGIKFDTSDLNTYDWRIMDLQFINGGYAVDSDGEVRDILLLRLHISDYTYPSIMFTGDILLYYNANHGQNHQPHNRLAIVDCNISQVSGWTVFGDIRRFALMGCYLGPSLTSHVIRFEFLNKAVISNNYITEGASQRHLIKLHGPDWAGSALFPPETYTEKVIFSDNFFNGGSEDWFVAIGPTNGASDERIRDIIFERNFFNSGNTNQILLILWSSFITVRNNIFNLSYAQFHTAISIKQRGIEPAPENISIYNNTVYSNDVGDFTFVSINPEVSNTIVRNNLGSAPNANYPQMINGSGSGLIESNNLLTDNPGFIIYIPVNPEDFNLQSGSPAIDSGIEVVVFDDYSDSIRPFNDIWDIGAYEYVETSGIDENIYIETENIRVVRSVSSLPGLYFSTPFNINVKIDIFDISGRFVTNLFNGNFEGERLFNFKSDISGSYIYRITADEKVYYGQIIVIY